MCAWALVSVCVHYCTYLLSVLVYARMTIFAYKGNVNKTSKTCFICLLDFLLLREQADGEMPAVRDTVQPSCWNPMIITAAQVASNTKGAMRRTPTERMINHYYVLVKVYFGPLVEINLWLRKSTGVFLWWFTLLPGPFCPEKNLWTLGGGWVVKRSFEPKRLQHTDRQTYRTDRWADISLCFHKRIFTLAWMLVYPYVLTIMCDTSIHHEANIHLLIEAYLNA